MLADVVGRTFGPFDVVLSPAKIAEYVEATSDDPARWEAHAPPSYAGALLFRVAPSFLGDPDVQPDAAMVIHGEQSFTWHRPFAVGSEGRVTGTLDRVRARGDVAFASFSFELTGDAGPVLSAGSTFLMSGSAPPGGQAEDRIEPAPHARRKVETPVTATDPARIAKSASRADLVRYAAASGDFNPIHWDHALAASAGLGGVVAHGLLVAAWALQSVAAQFVRPDPLATARIRFREPLYPDQQVLVQRTRPAPEGPWTVVVASDTAEHVAAKVEARED